MLTSLGVVGIFFIICVLLALDCYIDGQKMGGNINIIGVFFYGFAAFVLGILEITLFLIYLVSGTP